MSVTLGTGRFYWSKADAFEDNRVDLTPGESGNSAVVIDGISYDAIRSITANQWYEIKVVVDTGSGKAYLDGELLHDISVGNTGNGVAGVSTPDGQSCFERISVRFQEGLYLYRLKIWGKGPRWGYAWLSLFGAQLLYLITGYINPPSGRVRGIGWLEDWGILECLPVS